VAALGFGIIALVWHDGTVFGYAAAAAQIFGGAGIQFRRTAKVSAALLGVLYLVFTLRCVPGIVAAPQVYNSWGNFFEQLSLMTGPAIVYARWSSALAPATLQRIGRILLGLCVGSFAAEQAVYLDATAHLVPKWIPPSQLFWAVATTGAFALAAVALLTNRLALVATRLLTAMIVLLGLLVWVPLLLADPHNHSNWTECVETFAIAGTAWTLADLLGESRLQR
jgi:hypothetical protein